MRRYISPNADWRGTILGTLQYMAPEQPEGKPADARTDILAFGAVLYEMLTGERRSRERVRRALSRRSCRRAHRRSRCSRLGVPPALDRVVTKCLAKDPDERWQSAHDRRASCSGSRKAACASTSMRALADPAAQTAAAGAARTSRVAWLVAAVATLAVVGLSMPTIRYLRETPAPSRPEMRVEINPPAQSAPLEFSLSPDGRHIVFVASVDGRRRLWLRALNKMDAQAMTGTDGAAVSILVRRQPFDWLLRLAQAVSH